MRPLYGLAALCVGTISVLNIMFAYLPMPLNFLAILGIVFLLNKFSNDDFNFKSVSIVVGVALLIEIIIVAIYSNYFQSRLGNYISNNFHFTLHFILDFLVLSFIANRRAVMLYLFKGRKSKHSEILKGSLVDAPLYGVFVLFCIADLLALVENLVRSLERIGVSEEFAKAYWSWTFIFDNYEIIKATLFGLMFMTLFACAYIANKQSKRMEAQGAA